MVYKYKGVYFKKNNSKLDYKYSIGHRFMPYNCSFMVQGLSTLNECKQYINLLLNYFKVDYNILKTVSRKFVDNDYTYLITDKY